MKRDDDKLDALLHDIILQPEYTGNACLTEAKLIEFVLNRTSDDERAAIAAHFETCPHCRDEARDLAAAAARFLAADGTPEHLSLILLRAYAERLIPDDEHGRRLTTRIENHLNDCPRCSLMVEQVMATTGVFTYDDMRQQDDLAAKAVLLFGALAALAAVRVKASQRNHLLRPGWRGDDRQTLTALLLDETGRLVLDEEDNPRSVSFGVIKAAVDERQALILDLSTPDKAVWADDERKFTLIASLAGDDGLLKLPPVEIRPDGRASIRLALGVDVRIDAIPLDSIILTVIPSPE